MDLDLDGLGLPLKREEEGAWNSSIFLGLEFDPNQPPPRQESMIGTDAQPYSYPQDDGYSYGNAFYNNGPYDSTPAQEVHHVPPSQPYFSPHHSSPHHQQGNSQDGFYTHPPQPFDPNFIQIHSPSQLTTNSEPLIVNSQPNYPSPSHSSHVFSTGSPYNISTPPHYSPQSTGSSTYASLNTNHFTPPHQPYCPNPQYASSSPTSLNNQNFHYQHHQTSHPPHPVVPDPRTNIAENYMNVINSPTTAVSNGYPQCSQFQELSSNPSTLAGLPSLNGEAQKVVKTKNKSLPKVPKEKKRKNSSSKQEPEIEPISISDTKVKCPLCEKILAKGSFASHKLLHTGEKPHECPECGIFFRQLFHLRLHRDRKHFGKKEYKCDICLMSFFLKDALKRHMGTHNGMIIAHCPDCNAPFNNKRSMTIHEKHVHRRAVVKKVKCLPILPPPVKVKLTSEERRLKLLKKQEEEERKEKEKIIELKAECLGRLLKVFVERISKEELDKCLAKTKELRKDSEQAKEASTAKVSCKECGDSFQATYQLQEHLKVHRKGAGEKSNSMSEEASEETQSDDHSEGLQTNSNSKIQFLKSSNSSKMPNEAVITPVNVIQNTPRKRLTLTPEIKTNHGSRLILENLALKSEIQSSRLRSNNQNNSKDISISSPQLPKLTPTIQSNKLKKPLTPKAVPVKSLPPPTSTNQPDLLHTRGIRRAAMENRLVKTKPLRWSSSIPSTDETKVAASSKSNLVSKKSTTPRLMPLFPGPLKGLKFAIQKDIARGRSTFKVVEGETLDDPRRRDRRNKQLEKKYASPGPASQKKKVIEEITLDSESDEEEIPVVQPVEPNKVTKKSAASSIRGGKIATFNTTINIKSVEGKKKAVVKLSRINLDEVKNLKISQSDKIVKAEIKEEVKEESLESNCSEVKEEQSSPLRRSVRNPGTLLINEPMRKSKKGKKSTKGKKSQAEESITIESNQIQSLTIGEDIQAPPSNESILSLNSELKEFEDKDEFQLIIGRAYSIVKEEFCSGGDSRPMSPSLIKEEDVLLEVKEEEEVNNELNNAMTEPRDEGNINKDSIELIEHIVKEEVEVDSTLTNEPLNEETKDPNDKDVIIEPELSLSPTRRLSQHSNIPLTPIKINLEKLDEAAIKAQMLKNNQWREMRRREMKREKLKLKKNLRTFTHQQEENEVKVKAMMEKMECSFCFRKFTTCSSLTNHLKGIHPEFKFLIVNRHYKEVQCKICGQFFTQAGSLTRHVTIAHLKIFQKCKFCDKNYSPDYLKAHIKVVHEKEKPFMCEFCGKLFAVSNMLNVHLTNQHADQFGNEDDRLNAAKCSEALRPRRKFRKPRRKYIEPPSPPSEPDPEPEPEMTLVRDESKEEGELKASPKRRRRNCAKEESKASPKRRKRSCAKRTEDKMLLAKKNPKPKRKPPMPGRKRGRPRKNPLPPPEPSSSEEEKVVKKPVSRKRKLTKSSESSDDSSPKEIKRKRRKVKKMEKTEKPSQVHFMTRFKNGDPEEWKKFIEKRNAKRIASLNKKKLELKEQTAARREYFKKLTEKRKAREGERQAAIERGEEVEDDEFGKRKTEAVIRMKEAADVMEGTDPNNLGSKYIYSEEEEDDPTGTKIKNASKFRRQSCRERTQKRAVNYANHWFVKRRFRESPNKPKEFNQDEEWIKCKFCSRKFLTDTEVAEHEAEHKDHQFNCPACGYKFIYKYRLKSHFIRVHKNLEVPKFLNIHGAREDDDEETLTNGFKIRRVRKSSVNTVRLKYSCKFCDQKFSNTNKLKTHEFIHKKLSFGCTKCSFKSFLTVLVKKHISSAHGGCASLKRLNKKKTNEKTNEGKDNGEKDESDNENVEGEKNENEHEISFENEEVSELYKKIMNEDVRFNCDECPASYNNTFNFTRHMLSAHGVKVHFKQVCRCKMCGAVFKQRKFLFVHLISKVCVKNTVDPFMCEKIGCDHVAEDVLDYRRHLEEVHGQLPKMIRGANFGFIHSFKKTLTIDLHRLDVVRF